MAGMDVTYTILNRPTEGALTVGQRVQATIKAGVLNPSTSGHPANIRISDQRGTITCWVGYVRGSFTGTNAVVDWDAQTWHEDRPRLDQMEQGKAYSGQDIGKLDTRGTPVELKALQSLIHPDYLVAL